MFVFSLKTTPHRLYGALGCLLLSLTLLGAAALFSGKGEIPAAAAVGTEDERLTYLRSLEFAAEETPIAIEEILLPEETDDVFTAYNAVQLQAGFDLTKYCGKRVKRFSYTVSDDDGERAVAHLYVYRDVLVGGDVTPQGAEATPLPLQKQRANE